MLIGDQRSFYYKFRNWWSDYWNQFDAVMYSLMIASIIMRFRVSDENFVWARILYSITLSMTYLRLVVKPVYTLFRPKNS